jgi:hypothetical protein
MTSGVESTRMHLAIPLLLSCLLIEDNVVEAATKYSSWTRKYNYGQKTNYKSQYEYLYGDNQEKYNQNQYQYQKQDTDDLFQDYNYEYYKGGGGNDDGGDDDGANDDGGSATSAPKNSYADDPGFSFFFEDTAGCAGSGYNLMISNLTFTCGDGDYHGFDPYYVSDDDAGVYDDQGNFLYPKRHYCQFDETITVSGTCE